MSAQLQVDESTTPWITWFGDDFTGSTAAMEALAFSGVPSVLFTDIPSQELLERFKGRRAIGLASTARSKDPDWMAENLPRSFAWLNGLQSPILHYKTCSTFDSSPETGSIGKAIEIGLAVRPTTAVPLLVAAPQMQRYQAFGHLFAGTFDGVFRLDRHPVMAHHPVTPMNESDLLRHLARQTDLPSALINLEMLWGNQQDALREVLKSGARILSIDSMEPVSEEAAGRLLWENRKNLGFVAGSQGVEYALVRYWIATGMLESVPPAPSAGKVDKIVAVSGSVSPTTAEQLGHAEKNGFELLPFPATCVCGSEGDREAEINRTISIGSAVAERGASPLIYTAKGPDDPDVEIFRHALSTSGLNPGEANERIGNALGRILGGILLKTGIRRAVISGGDTSGYGMQQLNLQALVAKAPTTIPGAPICEAHGDSPHDGLEIALKGGQMGSKDFFCWVRDGAAQ